jgi:hypothetical protein
LPRFVRINVCICPFNRSGVVTRPHLPTAYSPIPSVDWRSRSTAHLLHSVEGLAGSKNYQMSSSLTKCLGLLILERSGTVTSSTKWKGWRPSDVIVVPEPFSPRCRGLIVLVLALRLVSGRRTNQSTLSCVHPCTPIADRQNPSGLVPVEVWIPPDLGLGVDNQLPPDLVLVEDKLPHHTLMVVAVRQSPLDQESGWDLPYVAAHTCAFTLGTAERTPPGNWLGGSGVDICVSTSSTVRQLSPDLVSGEDVGNPTVNNIDIPSSDHTPPHLCTYALMLPCARELMHSRTHAQMRSCTHAHMQSCTNEHMHS